MSDPRSGKQVKRERRLASRQETDLQRLFERFYRDKVAEGRSSRTLGQYLEGWQSFREYLDTLPPGTVGGVEDVTPDLVRDYAHWLLTEKQWVLGNTLTMGLQPSSVNTRLKTLRAMFTHLQENEVIERSPMEKVRNVVEREKPIRVLTVEELQALLRLPDRRTYAGFRDYVLMTLLIDAFLRINEALTLREQDVDFGGAGILTVRGEISKNRKSRLVPLSPETLTLLSELVEENREFHADHLFLCNYGEPLSDNHFRHRLKQYVEQAGLDVRVYPHLFRHTAATMFLQSGGDIAHLQKLLGHAGLRMVLRYTHLDTRALREQHSQHTPLHRVLPSKLSRQRRLAL